MMYLIEKPHMESMKFAVLSQLGKGKANAVSGPNLAKRLGEKDTRHIRLAIIELIKDGYPIIGGSSHGYFIAETAEECNDCLDTLLKYLKSTGYHRKILLRAAMGKFSGQIKMRLE